ncbi:sugar phosphate isomerase/epimerase family protein [Larkinella humicola]|uniref:Sugar phosphate isomerase/epimerase n=1 Tax=Larkinella humicola TaxID=2607654 RepID=A0A5N1J679_9BACT|nr:sugar phosphate isomerase/epimerase [Larkinella humicola]KAA9346419.1 sugar phosphate isomerase/epimerase [Larkinella humicola]
MKTFLLSLLFVAGLTASAFAQPKSPVGLQLYSFREQFPKDVPGMLAKVRQMGFREVELAGTYGMAPADFRKLVEKNGLKPISTGASYEDLSNNVPKVIEEAKALGVKYVMCAWIPHKGDVFTLEDAKQAADVLNTAGKLLKDHGILFCYHIHGYEFQPYKDGTFFDYLAENLEPRYCNFEMDVFWVKHPGQDPVALLKKYPNRFPLMHLKDRKPGTPGNNTGHVDVESNVAIGKGDLGIAEIMKQAKKSGVKHYFIEDESSRSMEQMPESVAYLQGLK